MTMTNKSIKLFLIILSFNLLFSALSFSQVVQRTVKVVDEDGNPITNASIIIGEGAELVFTDEKGQFQLPADTTVAIFIMADGYKSKLISSCPISTEKIELMKSVVQMGDKDMVNVPFGSFTKRQVPGAETTLYAEDILNYDQTSVNGLIYGRVPGMFGSSNIRGMGDALVIVDGIPRPASTLNAQQIEKISVLKDQVSGMMYGSQATNGLILITTKRGEPLRKKIEFLAENGFVKPISYPKFLNSADYMTLYNEALTNDGKMEKYSAEEIANTRSGIDPVHYPDESYYNSTYLKDWTTFQNVVGEASGGSEIAQYYLNLGWNHENGFLDLDDGIKDNNNRLNMMGNIDYKLSEIIKLRFDGSIVFDLSKAPRYSDKLGDKNEWSNDFWGISSTLHPNYYPVLIPADLIEDEDLLAGAKLIDNKYVLGGTSEYLTNLYGELTRNGPRKINQRYLRINTGLDFDLKDITKGLKASLYLSFDMYNMFQTDILNDYAVYKPYYSGDTIYSIHKYGNDIKVDNQSVTQSSFYRRFGFYGTIDYSRSFGDNDINVTGLAYRDEYSIQDILQPVKHLNFGIRANYMLKDKYIAELTGVAIGSSKLFETAPFAFSSGVGLGWVLSEENFLKGNPVINFLKIRANWAMNNSDQNVSGSYLGVNTYTKGTDYQYNYGLLHNYSQIFAAGNPNLGWEKIMNVNAGFEAMLFNTKLSVEATYFYNKYYDLLSQGTNILPAYYASLPYINYGSNRLQGGELGLNYRNSIGKVEFKIGGNIVYSTSEVLKSDALNYPNDYQNREGKPIDAIYGYVSLGMFKDQNDIDNSPVQTFGDVQPGDIKYEDLNNDNVIDENDRKMIGNSEPNLGYGVTLNVKYKALQLFVLGTGQGGEEVMFNDPYYWVYGDRKYSEVVLNRWTEETASTATYPRLSSSSNSNDFTNSTFWMYKNNWFKLQTVQLSYTLQTNNFAGLNNVRFFLRAFNLFEISKIKDKTELNVGRPPQTRGITIGLNLLF